MASVKRIPYETNQLFRMRAGELFYFNTGHKTEKKKQWVIRESFTAGSNIKILFRLVSSSNVLLESVLKESKLLQEL